MHEVPSGTGGTQSSVDGATPRRTTTGSSQRPRAKGESKTSQKFVNQAIWKQLSFRVNPGRVVLGAYL